MNGALMLAMLVVAPFVVALVATRLGRSRSFVIWSAVVAQLITIALTRMWSRHVAARALARARAEHRDLLIAHMQQTFQHELVVGVILSLIAAVLAMSVFTIARPTRA